MADRDQLYTALRNADAAGDQAGARALASYIQSLPTEESAAVSTGKAINSIPRQVGLTARYALEGPAQAAQIFTEPVAGVMRAVGVPTKSTGQLAAGLADFIGLPKPESSNERAVGEAAKLLAGSGATMGAGTAASVIPGIFGKLGAGIAANPVQQLSGAVGAGLAGGASKEAGGNEWMQAGAGVLGGLAGSAAPSLANSVVALGRRALAPIAMGSDSSINAAIDMKIAQSLQSRDVDYTAIPEKVKQALRTELKSSIQAGKELNPDAVRRFADFQATGLTPTRGMLTQDPVQITREQNLAKMGANGSDDALHGLSQIQNRNNAQMIQNLETLGSGRANPFGTGELAISNIRGRDQQMQQGVTALYERARQMTGGDIPIERKPIIDAIYDNLVKQNKMAFLPDDIGRTLNDISAGTIKVRGQDVQVPFNADTVDMLKTMLSTAQRGTQDGNVKAALGIARGALDSQPIRVVDDVATNAPAQFMGALNEARSAAAKRFGWQESSRPVEIALKGAEPDKFFQQNVIRGTVTDTKAFAEYAGAGPTRDAVLGYLQDKALNGQSQEVGKFSQSAFNKALKELGDKKLEAVFEPDQLAQLKSLGRAASYAQAQPVGSAVNNSNSGALVLGRGADLLGTLTKKIPFGRQVIAEPLQSLNIGLSQRQAQNVLPGLLAPIRREPIRMGLLAPSIALGGGLLSAPAVP